MIQSERTDGRYFYHYIDYLAEAVFFFEMLEADLFSFISKTPNIRQLAEKVAISEPALRLLLSVMSEAGWIIVDRDWVSNQPLVEQYLVRSSDVYLGEALQFRQKLASSTGVWQQLQQMSADGRPRQTGQTLRPIISFTDLAEVAAQEIKAYRWAELENTLEQLYREEKPYRMLDLGGGSGLFSIKAAEKYQALKVTLFDQEAVLPFAKQQIVQAGLQERITVIGGDFMADSFGRGYDLILAAGVIDFAGKGLSQLVKRLAMALTADGWLVICSLGLAEQLTQFRFISRYLSTWRRSFQPVSADQLSWSAEQAGLERVYRFIQADCPVWVYRPRQIES